MASRWPSRYAAGKFYTPTVKRPQLVSKGSLQRTLQGAGEAWNQRNFEQYFDLMERAAPQDPANHQIPLDLGLAYGVRYDYSAANCCFEKAVRVAPNKTEALVVAGTHSRNFGRYDPSSFCRGH
jgi:hypothetical protein